MAARDARHSHPAATHPAIPLDGFVRVVRAGRVVAAARGQDLGKSHLVAVDQKQQQPGHSRLVGWIVAFMCASLSAASEASALSSANDISSARRRAIRTTSYRIPTRCRGESGPRKQLRATSRRRRRARLREVARNCFLGPDSPLHRVGIRYDVVLIARRRALEMSFAELKAEASLAALRLAHMNSTTQPTNRL